MAANRMLRALDQRELELVEAPAQRWWDRPLAIVLAVVSVVEILVTQQPLPGLVLVAGLGTIGISLWRRQRPLAVALGAVGAELVSAVIFHARDVENLAVFGVGVASLMIVYALARWAPVNHILVGMLAVVSLVILEAIAFDGEGWFGALANTTLWLFVAALGLAMRYRRGVQHSVVRDARVTERESIARELHDVVAHHVSGIAIQAQAGRALASVDPDKALATLETIEDAASTALEEMRRMVGVLRNTDAVAAVAPQAGLEDLHALAAPSEEPAIVISTSEDLDDVPTAVGAAVFRVAQESVTNALRHARHARTISVTVERTPDTVKVRITDDGDPPGGSSANRGFGLVGMTERVKLLGGRLLAGPGEERGWVVDAELPVET